MKKTVVVLMVLTIVSKLFGFIRDVTLSFFYGASNISDAYLISTTIPMVIFSFVGTGITTSYIPMYSKIKQDYGVREGNRYTNNLINALFVFITIVTILGLLFTNQTLKIFALGFTGETLAVANKFTKITLFGIYFTMLTYIFVGFLQIKSKYIIPAIIGFPLNLIIILFIFLSTKVNIILLSIGYIIAVFSQLLLLLPFAYKEGYRYRLILNLKDAYIKKMIIIAVPVIIGVSVNQINVLVDRTIASTIATGAISALNYANKLNGFIQGIFVLSISTVMYPLISKMAAENNMNGLKKAVSGSVVAVSLLVIPANIGALIFCRPIVQLLFERGAFDDKATVMTSTALLYYSLGMIGFAIREVLAKAFYSLQDTKTPMINAIIAVLINITLNIVLSRFMGVGGLALATSISAVLCTGLLIVGLRKKIGSFGMKKVAITFIKILCASLIMGITAKYTYNTMLFDINANLSLIAAIGAGAITYFVIIAFMKIEEVDVILNTIRRKIGIKAAA